MPRFFVDPGQIRDGLITVSEDAHHIQDVLRMREGDPLTLCDGEGMDYEARIEGFSEGQVLCRVLEQSVSASEPAIRITLFQGLPKADKMEWILQKGTELGISAFRPVAMQRSIVKADPKKENRKTDRYRKIALAAAKQSGRGQIPEVTDTVSFSEAVALVSQFDLFLVPYENGRERGLKTELNRLSSIPRTCAILIGPEGGIDPKEIEALESAGARIVGLGPRILRTETAGFTAATMLLYHFDQME